MSTDTFGKVTYSWTITDEQTKKEKIVRYSSPDNIKDETSDLLSTLNQKSISGNGNLAYALKYLEAFRKRLTEAKIDVPDSANLTIENNDGILECKVVDFESFILLAPNLQYESRNQKSDEVKASTLPVIEVEKSE